ncbi:MAG: XRE family transcriptional regulator, partial [Cyanobacteria bacterium J06627_28]
LGETQPRISNLMNGEISRFSVDKLINLLGKVGMHVKIEVFSATA